MIATISSLTCRPASAAGVPAATATPLRQVEIEGLGATGQEPIAVRIKWAVTVDVARTNDPAATITGFFITARQDDADVPILVSVPREIRVTPPSFSSKGDQCKVPCHVVDSSLVALERCDLKLER